MKTFFALLIMATISFHVFSQSNVVTDGGGDASTNYVTKWEDGGSYKIQNSNIYDDETYIGFFTSTPAQIMEFRHNTPYIRLRDDNNTDANNGTCIFEFGQSSGGSWTRSGYFGDGFSGVRALGIALENSADFLISANANPASYPAFILKNSSSYIGINTSNPGSQLDVKGTLRLSGSTSGYVGFAPAAAAGSTTYTLPSADGSSGQVLQTNGSGVLSWATPTTSSTAWQILGNSGTTDGTHFVGTTDNVALSFRVYNNKAGRIDNAGSTFIGYQAGNSNTATTSAGFGYNALYSNTSGIRNTAIGYQTLYSNTTGQCNAANGYCALYTNTTGSYNTAMGLDALRYNTTGSYNTATGLGALCYNTSGTVNTAAGYSALAQNTTGYENTACGYNALYANTTGYENTAIGYEAGRYYATSTACTFVGYGANVNNNYDNATAIGNGTIATSSDRVELGNASVATVHGPVAYTYSDGRFKFNVEENVKGLEFIMKLRPVTYQMNTQLYDDFIIQNMPDSFKTIHQAGLDFAPSTAIVHSGFIAQEVDSIADLCGFTSSIVYTPANNTDSYALSYAELTVPLVKALQEQQLMIDSLRHQQRITDSLLVILQNCCLTGQKNEVVPNNNKDQVNSLSVHNIEINSIAVLFQNAPNPFSDGTIIKYFVPDYAKAQIVFYDEFGGQIKVFNIEEKGMGQLNVSASNLAAGMYSYSLIINGKIVDTKKMIKQ